MKIMSTYSAIRSSPAHAIAKLNEGEWLGATGFEHDVPHTVEVCPGIATIVSAQDWPLVAAGTPSRFRIAKISVRRIARVPRR